MSDDFNSYVKTHELVDEAYRDQEAWLEKTITSVARMGFFSSDRCIQEYADMSELRSFLFPPFLLFFPDSLSKSRLLTKTSTPVWNIEPLDPSTS